MASAEPDQQENPAVVVTTKRAIRGRTAALLGKLDDSSSDDDDDETSVGPRTKVANTANGSVAKKKESSTGIYHKKLIETKKEIKNNHKLLDATVEDKMLKEKQANIQRLLRKGAEKSDDDDTDDETEPWSKNSKNKNKKTLEDSPIPPSPPSPPPPPAFTQSMMKRRSISRIDQQLKELEMLTAGVSSQTHSQSQASFTSLNDSTDDEIINTINVKVLTKEGICTFEMNENEEFSKLYEQVAKKLDTNPESIVLSLKDQVIKLTETPKSIDLRIYNIIDCGKVASNMVQERIKIVNEESSEPTPSNMTRVIFQTEEGRKSRVKFLISKTEKFENVLKKYCEKKNLSDWRSYIIEFDGERVELTETPVDLDLDGDEVFDIKKGKKSTMQKVTENDKVYDYDDDILPA